MAYAQQVQENQANKTRSPAPTYCVGDKVWLNLKNFKRPGQTTKKFDWKNAKYTVTKVVSPYAVRLNVPGSKFPTFHVDQLRPAASDPLPSQNVDDSQPEPIVVDGENEWEVECIADEHKIDNKTFYAVKWTGYAEITWEPREYVEDTIALDVWEDLSDEDRIKLRESITVRPFSPPRRRGRPPGKRSKK